MEKPIKYNQIHADEVQALSFALFSRWFAEWGSVKWIQFTSKWKLFAVDWLQTNVPHVSFRRSDYRGKIQHLHFEKPSGDGRGGGGGYQINTVSIILGSSRRCKYQFQSKILSKWQWWTWAKKSIFFAPKIFKFAFTFTIVPWLSAMCAPSFSTSK